MMYVRAEDLQKWSAGSYERKLDHVEAALAEAVKGPIDLLATRDDGALFRTPDGALHEAAFTWGENGIMDITTKPSAVRQYDEAALPRLVADELRAVAGAMVRGEAVERTQVRALARVLRDGEEYWLSGVVRRVDEALAADAAEHWHTLYEANQERIRTAMWGQIRELEGRVPKTAYAKLPQTRLAEFESELRESLGILATIFNEVVDGIRPLVFDKDDEFFGAIRESLIAEAQSLRGLLAKAEQLMRTEDLERVAVAHDRLCGRAKTMEVVSAYITGRAKKGAEEIK